jgi:hypothetical protein
MAYIINISRRVFPRDAADEGSGRTPVNYPRRKKSAVWRAFLVPKQSGSFAGLKRGGPIYRGSANNPRKTLGSRLCGGRQRRVGFAAVTHWLH